VMDCSAEVIWAAGGWIAFWGQTVWYEKKDAKKASVVVNGVRNGMG